MTASCTLRPGDREKYIDYSLEIYRLETLSRVRVLTMGESERLENLIYAVDGYEKAA